MLVVDASVALAWGLFDEASAFAESALLEIDRSGGRVPPLWITEVLNGAIMAQRRNRFSADEADRFLATLAALCRRRKLTIADIAPEQAFGGIAALARDHGLTAYDASYLFLAQSESLTLATLDGRLRAAASRAGVPLWGP